MKGDSWPMLERCYTFQNNQVKGGGAQYEYMNRTECPVCHGPSLLYFDRCATCRISGRFHAEG